MEDHCKAIDAVLHRGRVDEVYNVGGHNEKKNIEIVQLVIKTIHDIMEKEPIYRNILKKKDVLADGNIDISWINNDLISFVKDRQGARPPLCHRPGKNFHRTGWLPETSFDKGIVKTIYWYLDNQEWVEEVTSGDYMKYYEQMYGNR